MVKPLKGSTITQGDTPEFEYRLNPGSNPHFNSVGWTPRFVAKSTPGAPDSSAAMVKTVGAGITIVSDLVARISLYATDTRSLAVPANGLRLYYEMQIASSTKVYTIEQSPAWFLVRQDIAIAAP